MKTKVFEYIVVEYDEEGEITLPGSVVSIAAEDEQNAREQALMQCVTAGNYKPDGVGEDWDVVVRPFV